jgi:hypothetical protein
LRLVTAMLGLGLCDVKAVCVIVRRDFTSRVEPAVPSAVPYEVRRGGNDPSKSLRTTYPTVRDGHRNREEEV